jgi:hypothetical protein
VITASGGAEMRDANRRLEHRRFTSRGDEIYLIAAPVSLSTDSHKSRYRKSEFNTILSPVYIKR